MRVRTSIWAIPQGRLFPATRAGCAIARNAEIQAVAVCIGYRSAGFGASSCRARL